MVTSDKILKVGIFGHYGNENLGDEAIIEATIQNLKVRMPNVILYGLSINPTDTEQRYSIPSYPIRYRNEENRVETDLSEKSEDDKVSSSGLSTDYEKSENARAVNLRSILKKIPLLKFVVKSVSKFVILVSQSIDEVKFLYRSYKVVKQMDALFITGSNQFLDNFGGPWGFPYTLLKWSVLAKISGASIYYISVGAGPLDSRLSKRFIRWALKFANYVSFRDSASKKLIESTGYNGQGQVFPDLAHSLMFDIPEGNSNDTRRNAIKPVVAINPMPMYDSRYWCITDDSKYNAYVNKLSEFSSNIIKQGYKVFLFSTQPKDENVIKDVVDRLIEITGENIDLADIKKSGRTIFELMDILATSDIAVTTRFHGTVLSLLAGKPTLGICYYRKTKDLLEDMGQGNYSVELDNFKVDDLTFKLNHLKSKYQTESNKIRLKNLEYREALNAQYDNIVSLL